MSENKFTIKTTVLEAIATLSEATSIDINLTQLILDDLKTIKDKDFLFKTAITEYFKTDREQVSNIVLFILSNVFEQEDLKAKLWELLKSRNYNDETKNKIMYLIKSLGEVVDYTEYVQYFENPDQVIDKDTEQMLDAATLNPESQIDFVDFISTLAPNDWRLMLTSLAEDFSGDNLANIFIPLIYTNLQNEENLQFIIELLEKTYSALCIQPLNDVIEYSSSQICKKLAQKQLNLLKLKGKNIQQAHDFYKNALAKSEYYEGYTTYLDGHGNQGVIIFRKSNNGKYQYFSAVIRDGKQILDCFGFYELSESEYKRILTRFINSQLLIKIREVLPISILKTAEQYSLKHGLKIPYEYYCWINFLSDTQEIIDLQEKYPLVTDEKYKNFEFDNTSFEFFDNWFFDENDDFFKKMIDEFLQDKSEELDIEKMFNTLKQNAKEENIAETIKYRLQIVATLMKISGNRNIISTLAAINNHESYSKLEDYMLKHSIYEYFLREKENLNAKSVTNIFQKNAMPKDKTFSVVQIENAIYTIEANW